MNAKALFLAVPLALFLVPASAVAQEQEVYSNFADLRLQQGFEKGREIFIVFDFAGNGNFVEVRGRFERMTDSEIVVRLKDLPRGRTTLRIDHADADFLIEIPEIRTREVRLTRKGMSRGMAGFIGSIAVGFGTTFAVAYGCHEAGCSEEGAVAGVIAGFAGGAVLGALLASPEPERVVYARAVAPEGRFTWALAPVVSTKQKGALFTITW